VSNDSSITQAGAAGALAMNRKRIRSMGQGKGLETCVVSACTCPRWWADGTRLTQAVNNVMSNSIKYTESGSITMTVTVYTEPGSEIQGRLTRASQPVEVPACYKDQVNGSDKEILQTELLWVEVSLLKIMITCR
jgi:signal transduction histidine kinase